VNQSGICPVCDSVGPLECHCRNCEGRYMNVPPEPLTLITHNNNYDDVDVFGTCCICDGIGEV
jgi:hypothetical protein